MFSRPLLFFLICLTACIPTTPIYDSPQIAIPTSLSKETPANHFPLKGDTPTMNPIPSTPSDPNLQSLIQKATKDLSQRLSVEKTQIRAVDAQEVIWSRTRPLN